MYEVLPTYNVSVPGGNGAHADIEASDGDGFPDVDWEWWLAANPGVVGWVTVPGTGIDYPIVQAPADDPQHYLWLDALGAWSYAGSPYLDAGCRGGLFGNHNAVVFAHNLGHGDDALFAPFSRYVDEDYAREHSTILLQSPDRKQVLRVGAADRIQGSDPKKRVSFESDADFSSWLANAIADAKTVIDGNIVEADSVSTFVTCSYGVWNDERTLVYAAAIDTSSP